MVWDIATGVPVISLEDPLQAAAGSRSNPGKGGAVKGLAWVMANPARLAIVLSGGTVLVWDVQGTLRLIFMIGCRSKVLYKKLIHASMCLHIPMADYGVKETPCPAKFQYLQNSIGLS